MKSKFLTECASLLMVNREEAPQIERIVTFEELAGPVGLPLLGGFGVLGVLGIAGACTLTSRDDLPIALSRRLLLTIPGYSLRSLPSTRSSGSEDRKPSVKSRLPNY